MDKWEPLIDRIIRESMDRGEFENLSGSGQPIDLTENPFEAPELRTVHRLLRNAGFAPAWIEERKDIEAEFKLAYATLGRANTLYCSTGDYSNREWLRAMKEFRERVGELNQRIRAYNLRAPAAGFHMKVIDVDEVISQLTDKR
jgi:DnaJ family protein C protein 28